MFCKRFRLGTTKTYPTGSENKTDPTGSGASRSAGARRRTSCAPRSFGRASSTAAPPGASRGAARCTRAPARCRMGTDRAHMHRATHARRMQHAPRDVHTRQRAMRALPTYVELRTCSMRHARLRRATMQWAPCNAQRSSARHPEQRHQRVNVANARHAACGTRSTPCGLPSARTCAWIERACIGRSMSAAMLSAMAAQSWTGKNRPVSLSAPSQSSGNSALVKLR